MIPAPFAYHRPRSLDETLGLLAHHGEEARVVAGGHSLIPMMKLRLARPEHLVDLQDLKELRGIQTDPDTVIIGAMTTQHELIGSEPADCEMSDPTRDCVTDCRPSGPILRDTWREYRQWRSRQ